MRTRPNFVSLIAELRNPRPAPPPPPAAEPREPAPIARRMPKAQRPKCGAKTRTGAPCGRRVVCLPGGELKTRCRQHGGASTGPKTPEGRERMKAAVRERWRRFRAERAALLVAGDGAAERPGGEAA
ncbi:MAG TPA: HGGxSTG domain-containing protein [Polyangiaceae bacterium]|nr:HGGxSTG domain-containing protein [Polyangiaceae bacterium]